METIIELAVLINKKHAEGKYVPKEIEEQCIAMFKDFISDKDIKSTGA